MMPTYVPSMIILVDMQQINSPDYALRRKEEEKKPHTLKFINLYNRLVSCLSSAPSNAYPTYT